MEKVLAIFDWWDGPLQGLATFEGSVCFYERIFDEDEDEWSGDYYLTPLDDASVRRLLRDWDIWCKQVEAGTYTDHLSLDRRSLYDDIVGAAPQRRAYRKGAVFHGRFGKGYIPIDCSVTWT